MDDKTPVLEPGEYCEVCGGTQRLGQMTLRDTLTLTVCTWCHEDKGRLTEWLAGEFEKAMEADPNAVRLPDGRWKFVDGPLT